MSTLLLAVARVPREAGGPPGQFSSTEYESSLLVANHCHDVLMCWEMFCNTNSANEALCATLTNMFGQVPRPLLTCYSVRSSERYLAYTTYPGEHSTGPFGVRYKTTV